MKDSAKKFNIALKLAYDGSHFWGWQKAFQKPTVEGTLQSSLERILQEPCILQAASRTDRGVHADGQWVNFFCNKQRESEDLKKSLNALLPKTIRVLEVQEMPDYFHPTLHAQKKEYYYQVCVDPVLLPKERFFYWHVPYQLDLKKVETACRFFLGEHDFSSFCNHRKNLNYRNKHRQIEILEFFLSKKNYILFTITGNNFLYKMVRNIIGTLIYVGRGKIHPESIPSIFATRQRAMSGPAAPAHGLTLRKIYYPQEFMLNI